MNKDTYISDAARIKLELSSYAIDSEIQKASVHYVDEDEVKDDKLLKAMADSLRCQKCRLIPTEILECDKC